MHNMIAKKCLYLFLILTVLFPAIPARAQGNPAPHLGYGIHLDPNVPVDPAVVDRLGMDWVKLYDPGQIKLFPNKRILYRFDIRWSDNLEQHRAGIAEMARDLSTSGVDAIEVHNEPNLGSEWAPRLPNAREYVEVLRVSYEAIKSTAPGMIVVSGGLAPTVTTPDRMAVSDIEFARDMLQAGAARWFDVFGYHPYGFNAAPEEAPANNRLNFRRTELIRQLLRSHGAGNKQMWLTEFGWLRDPAEDGVNCSDQDPAFAGFGWMRVSGQTQADYTARAFAYADRNWEWAGPMFLWNLNFSQRVDNASLPPCSHLRWFGLLKRDGSTTPVFDRVAAMPKRYAPTLSLVVRSREVALVLHANNMTVEVSSSCPGIHQVGSFLVGEEEFPNEYRASIQPAYAPLGPKVEAYPDSVPSGQPVTILADTTNLPAGAYIIYINVRAIIEGELHAQSLRGFVIITDSPGDC